MPTTADLLMGVALPMLLAAAIASLNRFQRGQPETWIALAIAAGYIAGHLGLQGPPPLWPDEAQGWLIHLVLAACLMGIASRRIGQHKATTAQSRPLNPLWILLPAGFTISALGGWAMLQSFAPESWSGEPMPAAKDDFFSFDTDESNQWTVNEFLRVLALIAVTGAFAWAWLGRSVKTSVANTTNGNQKTGEGVRPWAWLAVVFGAAGVIQLTGSATIAMLAGAFAASIGGAMLSAWGHWQCFRAAGPLVATVVGSLLIVGHFYSALPLIWAWLTFAALLPASGLIAAVWPGGRRRAAAIDLMLTLLIVGSVLALAARRFIADL